jgi:hypothetical protein
LISPGALAVADASDAVLASVEAPGAVGEGKLELSAHYLTEALGALKGFDFVLVEISGPLDPAVVSAVGLPTGEARKAVIMPRRM